MLNEELDRLKSMKKVIEDCVGLLIEDDKKDEKKKYERTEAYEGKNEDKKEKGGFVIKKTVKESEAGALGNYNYRDPLLRKKLE